MDRIAREASTVVCPVIDVIDDTTLEFHYRDAGGVNVGGFDWNLQVKFVTNKTVFFFFGGGGVNWNRLNARLSYRMYQRKLNLSTRSMRLKR